MQPHPNNDLYRIPNERGKGIAGTIIVHAVMFALLLLLGFTVPVTPPPEEGIEVNFGTDETGSGLIEPSEPASSEAASLPQPSAAVVNSQDEPLLTQNTEDAPEVKKVDPEAEKRRLEQVEAEKIRREVAEAERIKKLAEETERKRIEAERQRQEDILNRTKNALANSRNAGTNSTSEGITGGAGNQGAVGGSVDSQNRGDGGGTGNSGISYSLEGRGFQSLPLPKYEYQAGGRVVVEVSVDPTGKVVQAVPGVKGSTTLDEYLLRVAKDAALLARFEAKPDVPQVQKGTITYNFILK